MKVAVLGLDLALRATGYALPDGSTGTLNSGDRRGMERLDWVASQVVALADGHRPDVIVVESYAYSSRTSHAFELGELGGLCRWSLWRNGYAVVNVPPASLKRLATGRGNAPKEAMLAEAIRRLGFQGSDLDQVDAAWLREIGLWQYRDVRAVTLPASHLTGMAALSALPWPVLSAR